MTQSVTEDTRLALLHQEREAHRARIAKHIGAPVSFARSGEIVYGILESVDGLTCNVTEECGLTWMVEAYRVRLEAVGG